MYYQREILYVFLNDLYEVVRRKFKLKYLKNQSL